MTSVHKGHGVIASTVYRRSLSPVMGDAIFCLVIVLVTVAVSWLASKYLV